MGLLRSEQMKHGTLVLPVDRARHFVDLIGSCTNMQFEDMNAKDMHRPYKKYIQRIDEMERILRFLKEELDRVPEAQVITNNTDNFVQHADSYKLDEVEAMLKQTNQDFLQFKENNAQLLEKRNAALEERYVVQTAISSMLQLSAPSKMWCAARMTSSTMPQRGRCSRTTKEARAQEAAHLRQCSATSQA